MIAARRTLTLLLSTILIVLGLGLAIAQDATDPPPPPASEAAVPPAQAGDDDDSAAPAGPAVDPGPGRVLVIEFGDLMINRGTESYFLEAVDEAEADPDVRALVLVMDTPGGALDATRTIVKRQLGAKVPIVVYVAPVGSRAASAGVFITMAAHVAAMAPATNIGAAHPVIMSPSQPGEGEKDDEAAKKARDSAAAMLEKVTNDTVAFARNIAEQRGRNADWAEKAVRESVSIGVDEALELDVIDLRADSLEALLAAIDGRVVELPEGERVILRTTGPIERKDMRLAQLVLLLLTNPSIAYMLLLAGLAGWWVELQNPGLILPAALGSVCLLLFAFSLSAIPVNLLAVVFVVVGFGLLAAEVWVPMYGLFAVAGAAAMVFGGLFLVEKTPEFTVGVSVGVIAAVVTLVLILAGLVGWLVYRGEKRHVVAGTEGMVDSVGKVAVAIPGGAEAGRVMVQSELWQAVADAPIEKGATVTVTEVHGMVVKVVRT